MSIVRDTYLKFKKFFNIKSKTLLGFLLSYSIILIIPIITTFSICVHYQSALEKQQLQQSTKTLDSLSQNVSDTIKDIRELYSRTMRYKDINNIMSLSSPAEYRTNKGVEDFLIPLYSYSSDYIKSVFIYVKNSDTILASNAICDSNYYYKVYFADSGVSYSDWLTDITNVSEVSFIPYYNENDAKMEAIYRMPYIGSDGKSMVLCTVIDDNMFFRNMRIGEELFFCDIYVSDTNGTILSRYLNLPNQAEGSTLEQVLESYSQKYNFNTKNIYIDTTSVNVTTVSLKALYTPIIRQTMRFSVLVTLLCVFLCSLIIIYFCFRNYKPISEFMSLLDIHSVRNEYAYIRNTIENILATNMQLSNQTSTFKTHQRKLILSKYIIGNYSPAYIENVLKSNHIEFLYDTIAVCVFQIFDLNELFADTPELSEESRYNELMFIIDNIFTELYGIDGYTCDIIDSNGYIFCILNSAEAAEHINAIIEETMDFGINSIYDNFGIRLQYTVSSLNHTPAELSIACNEALYLLNYKNMVEDNSTLFYDSYKNKFTSTDMFFSNEMEQTLINYISNCQTDKAETFINEIFDGLGSATIPPEHLRCILIDIALVLFKIPNFDFDKNEQTEMLDCIFTNSNRLNDMKEFMIASIAKICGNLGYTNTVYKDKRLKQLTAFIDENFTNPNFSLKFIGNEFHLDTSYLTKQFKSRTGISIIDYANKLRIEKAKELIADEKHKGSSMENIAALVGYNNVRTFNRIFTKLEGITPAAYKKSRN